METITYTQTYGVERVYWKGKERWAVRCDGRRTTDMHFARRDFALAKAEHFIHLCHHDFIDFLGRQVHFVFVPEKCYC